ncbi:MAG TPA: hypothetical protein VJP78_04880 [Thermoleophilia bacterium]|nr:hypothetical protein [Thermoleophilia bacterium]
MRRHAWSCWAGKAAVIAAALLTIITVVGFCMLITCMLDSVGAHHDHDMSWDICAGGVVVLVAVPLLAVPLMNGRLSVDPAEFVYPVALHCPVPPPKSLALS